GANVRYHGPVILAFRNNNKPMADLLLKLGATINDQDQQGKTMLHHAISSRNLNQASDLIRQKADVTITDRFGNTPLHEAISGFLVMPAENTEAFSDTAATSVYQNEALPQAADLEQNTALLQELIASGAKINAVDNTGKTPALRANGRIELLKLL